MNAFLNVTKQLLEASETTMMLFILTLVFALPLGLIIALCTTSKFAPLRIFFKIIVWILRGTPLMLQIFVIYYVPGLLFDFVWPTMNTGWTWLDRTISTRFIAVLVAFSINYAAYFSEIFRGGIQSITKGQYEACQVLGMSKSQTFFKVILMQVIKRIVPPMSNEIITLTKDTSLANVIGVVEIIFVAKKILRQYIWAIFYSGLFYLILNGLLTLLFNFIEKKLSYYKV